MGRRVGRGTPPEGPRDHREAQERGRTGRIFLSPRSADFSDAVERSAASATPNRRAVGRHAEHSSAAVAPPLAVALLELRPRRPRRPPLAAHPAGAFHPQSTSRRGRSVAEIPSMPTATRLVRAAGLRIPRRRQVLMLEPLLRGRSATCSSEGRLCFRRGPPLASPVPRSRAHDTRRRTRRASRTHPFERRHGASQRCVPRRGSARAMAVVPPPRVYSVWRLPPGLPLPRRRALRARTTAVVTSWKTKSTTGRVRDHAG